MKTQVTHSTAATLGPFLRLVVTLTAAHEAKTLENLQSPAGEAPASSAAAASDHQQAPESTSRVFTRANILGPFFTLLLTLRHASSWADRDWWQGATAPRGAILAARYVSR